jgi:Mg/Co/Ni transporter MgtE
MDNDRDLVDELRRSLEHEPPTLPQNLLDLREPDVAEILNQLSLFEAAHTLRHLPIQTAIRLCDQPSLHGRGAILEQLEPAQAAVILEGLSSDERAQVLREMSPHQRRRMLPSLPKEICAEIEMLLRYPERTAGGIMTTEFVSLDPSMTPQQRVAQKIGKYNLLAVPVLEEGGQVVGFVTVDDVIDVMVEEETESALRMAAVEPGALDEPYMSTPFSVMVRKRATWLVVLFLGEMLTATAMGYFEDEIAKAVSWRSSFH